MRAFAAATIVVAVASISSAGAAQRGRAQDCCPERNAARDATVPFRVGETLTYDVAWARILTAGTATAKVVERKTANNSTAYALLAEGRPRPLIARLYPVYYKMDALADTVTLLSQWTS